MPFEYTPLISGLVGVGVGAVITHFRERCKTKTDTTFRLHEDFTSEYMTKCRSQADHFLRQHRGKSLETIYKEDRKGRSDVVWAVVYFYQRLWVAVSNERVDNNIAPQLFGEIFIWWYECHLRAVLEPTSWGAKHNLDRLELWIQKSVPATDYVKWLEYARNDRNKTGS